MKNNDLISLMHEQCSWFIVSQGSLGQAVCQVHGLGALADAAVPRRGRVRLSAENGSTTAG
jgi:hypothetical protein